MTKKSKKEKSNVEIRKDEMEITQRVKDYLIRAHSFQEVGTEVLEDEDYDVLHFPHLLLAAGVIMAIYGYFIIVISTSESAFLDGLAALIAGNVIATIGMIRLLKKYWVSFLILVLISLAIVIGMMVIWDYLIVPWAETQGILAESVGTVDKFINRASLVFLTILTFAYTACFVWYILARYTSSFYFQLFSRSKEKQIRFFIVDPWRKTVAKKSSLISDIIGRTRVPFFFLLTIILSLQGAGSVYFIQIDWNTYFESVLIMDLLLCAMVVLFPAFWLLDYIRYYNEDRLEVRSIGRQVLILVKGYAGFGTLVTLITRSQFGLAQALMDFFMVSLYLMPSLIILVGGYVLLTERDVYYIASKVIHGDSVIVEYKLFDTLGDELKWWLGEKTKGKKGGSQNE
jgi:hypothetical protein